LMPPLSIQEEEIHFMVNALKMAIEEVTGD
jgi:adenosylmethionine-8-amino-7-oxononanoate aminotransferase